MHGKERILVFQTAFIGDVVLALPLVQSLHKHLPEALIDFVAIPSTANVLANHPAVHRVIVYDKHGADSGIGGLLRIGRQLREEGYDAALVPHRSLRSALIPLLVRIRTRVGFSTSAGKFLFTDTVKYEKESHEIVRNLSLLKGLGIEEAGQPLPRVYPSRADRRVVEGLMAGVPLSRKPASGHTVAIAPGSIWNTKRWPKEYYAELSQLLAQAGHRIALLGSKADAPLCEEIMQSLRQAMAVNAAGALTLLQSAELIRQSRILVSNDSAPMHLAVAVGTPVVAIFGATVPEFGFAPLGKHDRVMETRGLPCRPCSIHGGDKCPIRTFDCMWQISPQAVFETIGRILADSPRGR